MQIVINMSKENLDKLKRFGPNAINIIDLCGAVVGGTPLPEQHSDLIERSSLDVDNLDCAYDSNFELDFGRLYTLDVVKMIENAPTIIPATKEGAE